MIIFSDVHSYLNMLYMKELKENNYNYTVIYKICCKDANMKDFCIGHTTNACVSVHKRKWKLG